ncbi:MAG: pyridoxal phosphate-dependent aminotransferase [Planctomycetota bacterium]|nr:pyridoxal phosphate-dependent aminotransferase [Planctomycetota bacterium]
MHNDPTARAPAAARPAPPAPIWPDAPRADLWFPYMNWAHTHANRTPCALSQSGMPPADPAFLEGLVRAQDLDHPTREALPALEEALSRRFRVPRSRVIVTVGATGGMFLAAAHWLRAGARVVTETPSYEPFRALPRFFGADVALVERRPEERWTLNQERVRAALARGSGPGHVFVANPNNPTGVLADRGAVAALAREAERAGGVLVSCDIYMEYVPRAEQAFAFECAPNAVSIGSLTKAYGLGALRIGWIVLGEALASAKDALVDIAYLSYVDPPTASMNAAIAALARTEALLAPLRVVEAESRPIFEGWLRTTPGIECTIPSRGIIAFPRVDGVADTLALAEFLVREHQVDVVPGEFFAQAGHVRIGCGMPAERLREGLARLERGIRAFRGSRAG